MRVGVIGATRGIGREVVRQGLDRGHQMAVLARDPGRMEQAHTELAVLPGDIRSSSAVETLLGRVDAVCTTIGRSPSLREVRVFSEGMRTVLDAMQRCAVRRLIAVTGIGAGDSRGHGGFLYDRIVLPLVLRAIYEDKDREERLIRESGVDWTIVRPGFLTNGPRTGKYRAVVDLEGVRSGRISRADVAHFILEELENGRYLGQAPLLTY